MLAAAYLQRQAGVVTRLAILKGVRTWLALVQYRLVDAVPAGRRRDSVKHVNKHPATLTSD